MYAPGTRYCRLLSVTISYYQLHSSRLELVQLDCAVAVDVEHLEEVIHLA